MTLSARPRASGFFSLSFAAVGLALALSAPVRAQDTVSAANPRQILETAKGFGSATLDTDSQGDPHISGRMDGLKYGITFYGCRNNANCDEMQITIAWAGKRPPLARVNKWNAQKRIGRVFLDSDGDLTMDLTVLTRGGISRTTLETYFEKFQTATKQLLEFVGDSGGDGV